MAIVKEWARPLEDALTEQLKATDPDPEALERVRQTAALLNGAPLSGKLERRLAEVTEQLERSYQAAARAVTQSATSDAVERGILSLTRYRGYRDADRILEEGRQRADALRAQEQAKARAARRRRTGIIAAIAVATIAVIAFFIVRSTLQNQRITQRVAQAQALADEGNTPGALDALNALAGEGVKGVSHPNIYALTETETENTASRPPTRCTTTWGRASPTSSGQPISTTTPSTGLRTRTPPSPTGGACCNW